MVGDATISSKQAIFYKLHQALVQVFMALLGVMAYRCKVNKVCTRRLESKMSNRMPYVGYGSGVSDHGATGYHRAVVCNLTQHKFQYSDFLLGSATPLNGDALTIIQKSTKRERSALLLPGDALGEEGSKVGIER